MIKDKPRRLGLVHIPQPLYFLTICTLHRQHLLDNERVHTLFFKYCQRASAYNVGVGRYVIMPDHLHLFVQGDENFDLGMWVRGLKRAISAASGFWQPGFFDHVLRSQESYGQKWEYVRENAVRAQLVSRTEEWPFQGEIVRIDRL